MRILLDVTRTLVHSRKATPTGIDRVEHAYIKALLDPPLGLETYFIANTPLGRGALMSEQTRGIFGAIEGRHKSVTSQEVDASFEQLAQELSQPIGSSRQTPLIIRSSRQGSKDDVLAVASAFVKGARRFNKLIKDDKRSIYLHTSHLQLDNPRCFRWLGDSSIFPVFFIHDLIPIEFPEFCSPGASQRHKMRISTALKYGKAILVNSEFTKNSLLRYADTRPCPPIAVVPLANTLKTVETANLPQITTNVPFFMHVGTIEGRKNIGHILGTWRHLLQNIGPKHTPRLVLIGRRGWECENVRAVLDRSVSLANHVIEVSGINDAGVHSLMQNATGLITASITEGFGLPPVEAARLGLPVIASDIPAHREILGDAAEFIATHDGKELADKVMALVARHGRPKQGEGITRYCWDQHVFDALSFILNQAELSHKKCS